MTEEMKEHKSDFIKLRNKVTEIRKASDIGNKKGSIMKIKPE